VWEIPILYHFNNKFDHKFSCGYPELNLFAKLSWSQVAHEHVTKEGTYLLLLNVILILNISAFCMPVMQCSQIPFCYKQTVPWHTLISHFHLIFRAMNLCHELEKLLSQITPAYELMNLWSKWSSIPVTNPTPCISKTTISFEPFWACPSLSSLLTNLTSGPIF
jgi:hypothetical protein